MIVTNIGFVISGVETTIAKEEDYADFTYSVQSYKGQ
jgi:hypothetical protein